MNEVSWPAAKKLSFRFLFIFFTLMASPWNWVPYLNDYIGDYTYYPSFFVQNYLLKMHSPPVWEHAPTGSGDTIDDWILAATWLAVAVIGCIVWSYLDRKRTNYVTLNYWFRVTLRYYLAVVLFSYGLDKIFPLQMPFPSLTQLHIPLGDLSPMRLAWLFIGYSVPYEIFGGLLETISGLLLSFRRTQLLGALMTLAVIGNVVMINFCYDIPVKLFSSQLFFMAFYVCSPDFKRLFHFFVLHKPIEPRELGPAFSTKRDKIIRWVLLGLFWVFGLGFTAYQTYGTWKETTAQEKFLLYGSYDVKQFLVADNLRTSPSDTVRWNQVVMDNGFQSHGEWGWGIVKREMNKIDRGVKFTIDSLKHFNMTFSNDTTKNFTGHYEKLNDLEILLTGRSRNDSLTIYLVKNDRKFKLETRPFHWVSAFPY